VPVRTLTHKGRDTEKRGRGAQRREEDGHRREVRGAQALRGGRTHPEAVEVAEEKDSSVTRQPSPGPPPARVARRRRGQEEGGGAGLRADANCI
jgi:hypothetical protein